MWSATVKRTTVLIVSEVTYYERKGSLNNESWVFIVGYSFRDALNIKFEERKKNKNAYMVWTQGPLLSFKEGDMIHSKDGKRIVQVRFADPMGWDAATNEMYQGSVFYSEYMPSDNTYLKLNEHTCTQMQFLQLLIHGEYDS
jgi:hypothetical protein